MYAHYWRINPQEWNDIAESEAAADAFFGYELNEEDDAGWDAYFELRRSGRQYLDIEKAWHALHFLLTGDNDYDASHVPAPWNYVVLGGNELPWKEDYGNVRFLAPAQVKEASQAMQGLSREELRSRLDAQKFNDADLYPGGEWRQTEMEPMLDIYDKVAGFFHAAAEAGQVIVIHIG